MDLLQQLQDKLSEYERLNASLTRRIEELQQSEARLSVAVASAHLGTWDWEPTSGALYWSEGCRKLYGLPEGMPVTFQLFAELIHPEDSARVSEQIAKQLQPGNDEPYDVIFRIFRFDNHATRWIRSQGQIFEDKNGGNRRFIGTALDITESRKAQEKMQQSERLFKSIAVNLPKALIVVIDKDHRFLLIEGDMMERMGYDSKDYIGKHPTEVAPAERYEANKELYERVINGEKFSIERQAQTGEDYLLHFIPLRNDDEDVYAGLIIALDISYLKQAEEKSAKLAAIVDSTDDAIISKSLEGIIESWNHSAERMFGYAADEMIGQPILKLIPPDRQEEEPGILSRLRSGERVEHFETRRLTKWGNLIDVSLTISPVRDVEGKIIGLSKIARDITSRKQEEQRKADFISMVSHELKTPLTSIIAYIQVLLSKARGEQDVFTSDALAKTEIQLKKMNAMISDFLSMARIEEGKMQVHKERFELQPLIDEIADDAQFLTTKHKITVSPCPVTVFADREKISLVLVNLIANAVKYSPRGGSITITCEKGDSKINIAIRDEGIGVSKINQERLFERFYRVNSDKVKTVSGFGIGLYLAAEILGYHDSHITVESEEGEGSTFSFSLDVAE